MRIATAKSDSFNLRRKDHPLSPAVLKTGRVARSKQSNEIRQAPARCKLAGAIVAPCETIAASKSVPPKTHAPVIVAARNYLRSCTLPFG